MPPGAKPLRLTVWNRTGQAVFLVRGRLRPGGLPPGADPPRPEDVHLFSYVHIEDEEGQRIRSLPIDGPPPTIGVMFKMLPDDTLVFEHVWDQRDRNRREVPPGRYRGYGELSTEPRPVRSRAVVVEIQP